MKKYILSALLLICPLTADASEFLQQSEFDVAQSKIKYSLLNSDIASQKFQDSESGEITYKNGKSDSKTNSYKSPGKAFAMSLLIPGMGQLYVGDSKLKSLAFFGTEVTSWILFFKWGKDADDLTAAYEKFNNDHWIESRYIDMLQWTYGLENDDNTSGLYPELSHHLPKTKVQQYYEMTGKYDQFSWGWDDAMLLSDSTVYGDYSLNNPFPVLNSQENIPFSARRNAYEIMRDDANNKYSQARKMVYVSMINRMFAAFEALIAAKRNNRNSDGGSILSSLSAEASFKSSYVKRDTPYITLSMKF